MLNLEELESRLVPAPTSVQQAFLDQINTVRADPAKYGQSIGLNLSKYPAAPPLAWSDKLAASAHLKGLDLSTHKYYGHTDSDGGDLTTRAAAVGYTDYQALSEDADAGWVATSAQALKEMMFDIGVPNLGHQRSLIGALEADKQIGIDIQQNVLGNGGYFNDYYTIELGELVDPTPFLVVPGGSPITIYGVGLFTFGSVIPLQPGHYDVLINGQPHSLEMGTQNLSYVPGPVDTAADPVALDYAAVLGRQGSFNERLYWWNRLAVGLSTTDMAALFLSSVEYRVSYPDYVSSLYQTVLHRRGRVDEVQYWQSAGLSDLNIALGFLNSPEYKSQAGI